MKKIIRRILLSLSAAALALTLSAPVISSYMQSYYKGLIAPMQGNTQIWLEKKQAWAAFGETKIFITIFLVLLFSFLFSELVIRIKKARS